MPEQLHPGYKKETPASESKSLLPRPQSEPLPNMQQGVYNYDS